MRKNIYFNTFIKRENMLEKFLLNLFFRIASYPRLLLEVFIRKNMGERYINLASVISVAFIMLLLPVILYCMPTADGHRPDGWWGFPVRYATWYVFLGLFLYHSWQRRKEIQKSASSFDFTKFSRYAGDINPWFSTIQLFKSPVTPRKIEILYEPGVFFLGGVVLWVFGQPIGLLLAISAFLYSMSYVSAYWQGDNFVLDRIDEMIFNEEMIHAFVDDADPEDTRGVRFYADKPSVKSLRKKVADAMMEGDEDDAAEVK